MSSLLGRSSDLELHFLLLGSAVKYIHMIIVLYMPLSFC